MRFKRYDRHPFTWSTRKEAAAKRRLKREADALPLFAEQIREEQPSMAEIQSRRAADWSRSEARMRAFRAGVWRQVRADFFAIPAGDRHQLADYWNQHPHFPGDPTYLAYVVRQYRDHGLQGVFNPYGE